jgi:hypothetical protein
LGNFKLKVEFPQIAVGGGHVADERGHDALPGRLGCKVLRARRLG